MLSIGSCFTIKEVRYAYTMFGSHNVDAGGSRVLLTVDFIGTELTMEARVPASMMYLHSRTEPCDLKLN